MLNKGSDCPDSTEDRVLPLRKIFYMRPCRYPFKQSFHAYRSFFFFLVSSCQMIIIEKDVIVLFLVDRSVLAWSLLSNDILAELCWYTSFSFTINCCVNNPFHMVFSESQKLCKYEYNFLYFLFSYPPRNSPINAVDKIQVRIVSRFLNPHKTWKHCRQQ